MMDFRLLAKAGVQFGHITSRWNPRMKPYIWGFRNNIHLIDVSKTAFMLDKASAFLKDVASEGKTILWVGTKKPAQNIIKSTAISLKSPYVTHRWIGGTLTNHQQVKKAITKLLHFEDVLKRSEKFPYTKKELNMIQKDCERLEKNVGGIRSMSWPVAAVVVVDVRREHTAVREANNMGVPVIGLVDTNSDPSMVDYVIPANDDAPRSIKVIIDHLAAAVEQGKKEADKKVAEKATEEKAVEKKAAPKKDAAAEKKDEPKKAAPKKEVAKKAPAKKAPAKKEVAAKKTPAKKSSK